MANKITVTSAGTVVNTSVTPDTAMYYSNKSKEWAISDRIVDNTDYSSKYYANESKKQADISTAKTTEVIESGNTAVSNIESARDNAITDVNTAGATQVALATEQATIATNKTSEVVASGNTALANIDTAKNNAITSITNQETTSKTSLIDEGATQIGLIQNEGATQVANVQSTGFYMRDDKLYFINSQGEETEFKSGGSGLELCDIGMALYVDEEEWLRRYLNGQILNRNKKTEAFFTRLQKITTLHPSLLCTEEEWQAAKTLSAFGQVGKFVFNYSGGDIISVRLPRVVNVQGLFDLQNLGLTVAESLPNITGFGPDSSGNDLEVSGCYNNTSTAPTAKRGGWYVNYTNTNTTEFNANNVSSTYQDGAPVQQEAIQYPYFIQIATGSETENNIVNDIELNNPYVFGKSEYSKTPKDNISWLASKGQWNPKGSYPSYYDWILENVNNGVEDFKLSTDTYDDYSWVINTTDETFRLPLLDGSEDLPNYTISEYLAIHKLSSSNPYVAKHNGLAVITSSDAFVIYKVNEAEISTQKDDASGLNSQSVSASMRCGDVLTSSNSASSDLRFYAYVGNGTLYYYVGETVQNADLIDAGRIGEQLADKVNMLQASGAGMPSNKYIDLTLGANDSTYTAPANGWFYMLGTGTAAFCFFVLTAITENGDGRYSSSKVVYKTGNGLDILLPVKKGQIVRLNYYNVSIAKFQFYYAEGEV